MSHYVLLVALPKDTESLSGELAERLEPFNENVDVEPYPDYEAGEAADYWWYRSLKRDAEAVANNDHSSIRPYNPDMLGWSSSESRDTPEQQWAEMIRDAEVFNSLPNPVTWESLVAAHNRYYCDGHPHSDGTRMYYESETGRAYTLSTYNPNSKWDWYVVGGRWSDYFPIKLPDARGHESELVIGERSWASNPERKPGWHCDGGRKRYLDLDQLRDDKEREAAENWDAFHDFAQNFPKAKSWGELSKEAEGMPSGVAATSKWDRLREVYRAQPLVQALREHPKFRGWMQCLIGEFSGTREDYLATARRDAVPGYAMLTLDGKWVAPGEMGWFGMSTEDDESKAEFKRWCDEYIDSLDDDDFLIAVDLHI